MHTVQSFGATGQKQSSAQGGGQQAVVMCAATGGWVVYFPPGAYTTGTITLRSHQRISIGAQATNYSSKNADDFPLLQGERRAFLKGTKLTNIAFEGETLSLFRQFMTDA